MAVFGAERAPDAFVEIDGIARHVTLFGFAIGFNVDAVDGTSLGADTAGVAQGGVVVNEPPETLRQNLALIRVLKRHRLRPDVLDCDAHTHKRGADRFVDICEILNHRNSPGRSPQEQLSSQTIEFIRQQPGR